MTTTAAPARLVAVEGLGPPPQLIRERLQRPIWERIDAWIEQVRGLSARQARRYPSIDAAATRMREENSSLSEEQARHLTVHGVARNEDGSFSWKFDNYERALFPQRWDLAEIHSLWARITCPTLLVRGLASWAGDPELDGSLACFRDARSVALEGAGHWVHHDRLDEFLKIVREFLQG